MTKENEDDPKDENNPQNEDYPKNEEDPKNKDVPKMKKSCQQESYFQRLFSKNKKIMNKR